MMCLQDQRLPSCVSGLPLAVSITVRLFPISSILASRQYTEPLSVLVAMRSKRYPSSDSLKPTAHNHIDLGLSLDISQGLPQEEHSLPLDWGALAEDPTIELCEVKLRFDGANMSMCLVAAVNPT